MTSTALPKYETVLDRMEWQKALNQVAMKTGTERYPEGGLYGAFYISLTDAALAARFAARNMVGDAAQRPGPPRRPPVVEDDDSEAAIHIHKMAQASYSAYNLGAATLRDLVIDSLAPHIKAEIDGRDGYDGIEDQTLPVILKFLEDNYSELEVADIACISAKATEARCDDFAAFPACTAKMRLAYKELATAGQPIAELEKLKHLKTCVAGRVDLSEALHDYEKLNNKVAGQKFEDAVKYVKDHAVIQTAQDLAYAGGAAKASAPVPKEEDSRVGKRASRSGKGGAAPSFREWKYCFFHGFNYTHKGTECFSMDKDAAYTSAMKQALAPCCIGAKTGSIVVPQA